MADDELIEALRAEAEHCDLMDIPDASPELLREAADRIQRFRDALENITGVTPSEWDQCPWWAAEALEHPAEQPSERPRSSEAFTDVVKRLARENRELLRKLSET